MNAKRLFGVVKGHREHIVDHTGRLYSDSEVADLLNTVCEDCNMYREDALKAEKDKEELLEEKEQLKTIINQLRTDNTKQKKLLNTTMKENEHIKQTIKDMIESERTEIGKMTLRQLWRQIQ